MTADAVAPQAPRKLLLIDDSEIVLAAEQAVLTASGFEVRAVSSLRAFLNALVDWQPHLIVTDLNMPEMHGDQLCRWLHQQVQTSRIPIVICSSEPVSKLEEVAREVGDSLGRQRRNILVRAGHAVGRIADGGLHAAEAEVEPVLVHERARKSDRLPIALLGCLLHSRPAGKAQPQ